MDVIDDKKPITEVANGAANPAPAAPPPPAQTAPAAGTEGEVKKKGKLKIKLSDKAKMRLRRARKIILIALAAAAAVIFSLWILGKIEEGRGNVCFENAGGKMMLVREAKKMAAGECGSQGTLRDNWTCDAQRGIWTDDLEMKPEYKREYCAAACEVYASGTRADVVWHCTEPPPPPAPVFPRREGMSADACLAQQGRVLDTVGGASCSESEFNVGEVAGEFEYVHLCCAPFPAEKRMTAEDALIFAKGTDCTRQGTLKLEPAPTYNPNSHTWWIDLNMKKEFAKEGCNPACVVSEFYRTAEINWRCTGLLPVPPPVPSNP
jgi:hypothetical protein